VSYSAVVTLAEAGCTTAAMVTEGDTHTSFAAFDAAARLRYRFPLLARTRLAEIHGNGRVTGITVVHADGRRARIECDTVVFTGDWTPESDLAVSGGLDIDAGTRGPSVDTGLRTSARGIFAAGNLLHPATTADVCAVDGHHVAAPIASWLDRGDWPDTSAPIRVEAPLVWCAPDRVAAGDTVALRLQTAVSARRPAFTVTQDGRDLWAGRIPLMRPTRPFSLPPKATARVVGHEPVVIRFVA